MATRTLSYKDAGVNYDALDPVKRLALTEAARTWNCRPEFPLLQWTIGESAQAVQLPSGEVIALVLEGLGTKNLIADRMREQNEQLDIAKRIGDQDTHYRNIGVCNVAMAVNDIASIGAMPIQYVHYFATGDDSFLKNKRAVQALFEGTANACFHAGCKWTGGETPGLAGLIVPGPAEFAGATWGYAAHKSQLIDSQRLRDGDRIVIVESNGIHANGLSLVRKIVKEFLPHEYYTLLPSGRRLGDELLSQTRIYVPLIEHCIKAEVPLNYAVNITGHGVRKFMRAKQPFEYIIERMPPKREIFKFLENFTTPRTAYETWNMGAGFALYVPPDAVPAVYTAADHGGFSAFDAGYVRRSDRKRVILDELGLVYEEESMQIR